MSRGIKYQVIRLSASNQSGGVNGSQIDCGRFMGIPWVQCVNSSSDSAVSGTVELQGSNDLTTTTGVGFVRLGSLALTAAVAELTMLLLSTVAGNLTPGQPDYSLPRYLRLRISTLSQGSPALLVGGYVRRDE